MAKLRVEAVYRRILANPDASPKEQLAAAQALESAYVRSIKKQLSNPRSSPRPARKSRGLVRLVPPTKQAPSRRIPCRHVEYR